MIIVQIIFSENNKNVKIYITVKQTTSHASILLVLIKWSFIKK